MRPSLNVFFIFLPTLILCNSIIIKAQPTYAFHICPNTTVFARNSTYQTNLNLTLSSLSSNANRSNGFDNTSAGYDAFGLFYCRGDMAADVCRNCVAFAVQDVPQRCPVEVNAVAWYDECFLRYSNQSFFSRMDTSPAAYLWNTANITNQSAFNILLATTMREAAATAAIGTPGGKKFAVKEANFTAFQKLYTLVQCTPDLSSSDCSRCLETAISQLPTCCGGKQGGRVLTASCIIRYEIYPFYNASAVEVPSSPPPSSPEIPPPPPTGSVTGSGGGISTATIIAIVAPIYVSVLLFGLGCIFLRRRAKKKYNTIPGDSLVDGDGLHKEKFSKWRNGVGTFHESARIDPTALIEIGAIIHPKAIVGPNVHVGSGAVIGPAVTLGHSTKIGYNVCLSNCTVGDSCVIHNGVCIGQDGFGFYVNEQGSMVKKPQLLNARIGNHVEIGANTCIDRGSWRDTVIGDHSKIDNLVQIGHNVVIGESCMLCGQVGIAGSVTIGDYVTLGGRVAVRDHVSIASKVRLAANSCVTKDIREPGDYGGFPAVPVHEWRRQVATYSRI